MAGQCLGFSKSAPRAGWEGDEVIRKGFNCHSEMRDPAVGGEGEERDDVQDISETKQRDLMNDCHEQEGMSQRGLRGCQLG